jgi:hypothetical protein
MSKRFTDTDKWRDEWWQSLSNDYKIIWQYLLDHCDHAGTIKAEFKLMGFMCDVKIDSAQFWKTFRNKVIEIENTDRWLIVNFCKNQYPSGLSSNKPAIVSVRNILLKYNVLGIIEQSFNNHYPMIKDKDKDMDMDMDKDMDKEEEKGIARIEKNQTAIAPRNVPHETIHAYFSEIGFPNEAAKFIDYYAANGWKVGKARNPMKDWKASVRNWCRRAQPDAGKQMLNRKQTMNDAREIFNEAAALIDANRNQNP